MPNPTPGTITELKAWYMAHNLPPEEITRFFIGKDIKEPKAFGIYQDGDRFVVYKNKADGSRAIRYEGPDEGYAVNQLYMKLKDEIANQKSFNAEAREKQEKANKRSYRTGTIIGAVICAAIIAVSIWSAIHEPSRGYYRYGDDWYYYQSGLWYYDYGDTWYPCQETPAVAEQYDQYYYGSDYDKGVSAPDFETTEYYSNTDSDSNWSSSDSWDSGTTDWSSDW